jgi:Na+/melibiose symporter-like transporter
MLSSLIEVRNNNLPAYAVFAAMLSAAGLPIYIHAPKYFVDEYGVSLAALGSVLFVLRLLDVVQDPLFGRLSAWVVIGDLQFQSPALLWHWEC